MKSFFVPKDEKISNTNISSITASSLPSSQQKPEQKANRFTVIKFPNDALAFKNSIYLSPLSYPETSTSDTVVVKLPHDEKNHFIYYPVLPDPTLKSTEMLASSIVRNELRYTLGSEHAVEFIPVKPNQKPTQRIRLQIDQIRNVKSGQRQLIDVEILKQLCINTFSRYPILPGQALVLTYHDEHFEGPIIIKVISKNHQNENDFSLKPQDTISLIDENTQFEFIISPKILSSISLIDKSASSLPKLFSLDFKEKGVGGHKEQLAQIIRDGFLSRAMPSNYPEAYGDKHNTKGILLYGPPGTGKTLIARVIGGFFTKDKVKIVNGPELKNKFVGQSEQNLRDVFKEAIAEWNEKRKNSDIHVIIFDEIDAICPRRGMRTASGVNDDMVAQLLTILDGIDSPKNIVVIGTTNRKDLVDPAVLRPGRLGIVIEIGLPDEQSRLEILTIHTKDLRDYGLLEESVNLSEWAKQTENYTGAEIEQLVLNASHYAMENNFDFNSNNLILKKDIKNVKQLAKVTHSHFKQAFTSIQPAFGIDNRIKQLKKEKFAIYNDSIKRTIDEFDLSLSTLQQTQSMNRLQLLLSGENGSGKSALAIHLAERSGAKCIKMLSPSTLSVLPLDKQLSLIDDEFEDAMRAEFSVIILDELENLIGANAELTDYNNILRLKFESLLKHASDTNNKCLIIATTSDEKFIKRTKLHNLFDENDFVKPIHFSPEQSDECHYLLKSIAESFGYEVTSKDKCTPPTLTITIKELVYQIKKFCASQPEKNQFDMPKFIEILKKREPARKSKASVFRYDPYENQNELSETYSIFNKSPVMK